MKKKIMAMVFAAMMMIGTAKTSSASYGWCATITIDCGYTSGTGTACGYTGEQLLWAYYMLYTAICDAELAPEDDQLITIP